MGFHLFKDNVGAPALAADGGVGLSGSDDLLIDENDHRRDADQDQADGEGHGRLLLLDAGVEHGGDGVIPGLKSQKRRNAEGAHGLGEDQDKGRGDGRHHQREGNLAQHEQLPGSQNLAHLLELRVDGAEAG